MLNINITVSGNQQAVQLLENLKRNTEDLSPEMSDLGDHFMKLFQEDTYESEGSAIGHTWPPLSPTYAVEKLKKWGSTKILVASGFMRDNYHLDTGSMNMTISNPTPYAPFHQDGGGRTPQRVIMDVQNDQVDFIRNTILNGIIGRLGI